MKPYKKKKSKYTKQEVEEMIRRGFLPISYNIIGG